jgi:hypothetical protein
LAESEGVVAEKVNACAAAAGANQCATVRAIDETAFNECSNLTNVQFCNEVEEFVSGESMRDWWNHGVREKCLST